jgi:hypothetical protein
MASLPPLDAPEVRPCQSRVTAAWQGPFSKRSGWDEAKVLLLDRITQ